MAGCEDYHPNSEHRRLCEEGLLQLSPEQQRQEQQAQERASEYKRRLTIPCRSLGEPTGETRDCTLCGGAKNIPLRQCEIHGQCTTERRLAYRDENGWVQVVFCLSCPDYQSAAEM